MTSFNFAALNFECNKCKEHIDVVTDLVICYRKNWCKDCWQELDKDEYEKNRRK